MRWGVEPPSTSTSATSSFLQVSSPPGSMTYESNPHVRADTDASGSAQPPLHQRQCPPPLIISLSSRRDCGSSDTAAYKGALRRKVQSFFLRVCCHDHLQPPGEEQEHLGRARGDGSAGVIGAGHGGRITCHLGPPLEAPPPPARARSATNERPLHSGGPCVEQRPRGQHRGAYGCGPWC